MRDDLERGLFFLTGAVVAVWFSSADADLLIGALTSVLVILTLRWANRHRSRYPVGHSQEGNR